MNRYEDPRRSPPESACVSIPEVLEQQYGMYVWPCAAVLAQFVWTRREQLRGRAVLELGAGVSLPGVLAAACGACVTLTDAPSCLESCRRSCRANGLQQVAVVGLTWGEVSPELVALLAPRVDVILGSDVFYDPPDFEDLLLTVAFLLRRNPQAQFWTTYQDRSCDWSMEALLRRWRLRCVHISLESFGADGPEVGGSTLPGRHSIQMMVITVEEEEEEEESC